jgi:uncharacterized protein (DUF433 family)
VTAPADPALDVACDVWRNHHPGQPVPADVAALLAAVVTAVQPHIAGQVSAALEYETTCLGCAARLVDEVTIRADERSRHLAAHDAPPGPATGRCDAETSPPAPQGSPAPVVCHTPGVRFGRAHIHGRPVEAIGDAVWDGGSVDDTAAEVMLGRADVIVACWWLGIHGTRAWRRRWRRWAESVHLDLAHGRWDVPDPPDRDGSREEVVKDHAIKGGDER